MISLIQRVTKAKVSIKRKEYASIGKGYVILLGIFEEDNKTDVKKLVDKIVGLRIMSDNKDKMNLLPGLPVVLKVQFSPHLLAL